jgi:putative redox protein
VTLVASARSIPGTLRTELLVDGRHVLETDEPPSVGGDGSAPAPHELLPAAIAACVATTIVMYARTKGWSIPQVTVDVDYDQRSTPRRADVAVWIDGDLGAEQLARLEQVAAACPVRRALEAGIAVDEKVVAAAR